MKPQKLPVSLLLLPSCCTNCRKCEMGVKLNVSEVNSFAVFSNTKCHLYWNKEKTLTIFELLEKKNIHELIHTLTRCCQLLYRVLLGFPATCWCLGVSAFWRLCHCPVLVDLISCLFLCVCPFWLWLIRALRFLNFSTACATLSAANFAAASPALSLAFCKACCPAFFCELTKHCRTNPSQVVCDDACTKLVAIHPSSFLGNPNSHQIRRLVHFDERIENFYVFFSKFGKFKECVETIQFNRSVAIVCDCGFLRFFSCLLFQNGWATAFGQRDTMEIIHSCWNDKWRHCLCLVWDMESQLTRMVSMLFVMLRSIFPYSDAVTIFFSKPINSLKSPFVKSTWKSVMTFITFQMFTSIIIHTV